MIEFSNPKIKVYGSETSETPIKEVDYEYTGSSIQDENLSVERGKSYFLYLEYYAKESMLNDNKPADENIVEETLRRNSSEDKPAEENLLRINLRKKKLKILQTRKKIMAQKISSLFYTKTAIKNVLASKLIKRLLMFASNL